MGRNIFFAVIGLIILSAIVYFLFPNSIASVYSATDSYTGASFSSFGSIGLIVALLYTLLFVNMGYLMLVIWFVVGIVIGVMNRGSMNGFLTGFYVPVIAFLIYYVVIVVNGYLLFITITPDMRTVFSDIIVPILSMGFIAGLGGSVGGHFRPIPDVDIPKENLHKLEQLIPRKCPKCGAEIYSSALYCSECGAELPEIVFSTKK